MSTLQREAHGQVVADGLVQGVDPEGRFQRFAGFAEAPQLAQADGFPGVEDAVAGVDGDGLFD